MIARRKLVIIEDEKINADHLCQLLAKWPEWEIGAVLPGNKQIEAYFSAAPMPDLVLSDIQLQDGTVFASLEKNLITCPIIFTTAFDNFYQEAFDANGIAYLLKPITAVRLAQALGKFDSLKKPSSPDWESLVQILKNPARTYKERILVKKEEQVYLLNVSDICYISTQDGICSVKDLSGLNHTFRYKLSELAEELDPNKFFQINRSEIIHLEAILSFETYFNDRLLIKLKGQKEKLITSASVTAAFRKWLESK